MIIVIRLAILVNITNFIWLNDRCTIAVPSGRVSRIFMSLQISGEMSILALMDSIMSILALVDSILFLTS